MVSADLVPVAIVLANALPAFFEFVNIRQYPSNLPSVPGTCNIYLFIFFLFVAVPGLECYEMNSFVDDVKTYSPHSLFVCAWC